MPFIPHTEQEIADMLSAIDVQDNQQLFDEIPASIPAATLKDIPEGVNELQLNQLTQTMMQTPPLLNFIGAGAYEHHIPAAVWEITGRGEFMTAYTPYQAEASQGSLQLIYEFQTMIASLAAMEVANASLYDGASALAESVLMAIRANRKAKSKRILMPTTVHPHYRETVKTIVAELDIEICEVDFNADRGCIDVATLEGECAAVVIPYPNFLGLLEDVEAISEWAHQHGALVIACANPLALTMLKPPGEWGADIVCGELQPFGMPLACGGPYAGYMCAKQSLVRQMPGRIVGQTVDEEGRRGFALTLQAREQHIRRSKATSNICTNQGLLVTAATIHMSLMGAEGLRQVALKSHQNTVALVEKLTAIDGVTAPFKGLPSFHEAVLKLEGNVGEILKALQVEGVLAGVALKEYYGGLDQHILVCATETKTEQDLDKFTTALHNAM